MMLSIGLSQQIFATDEFTALKSYLKHGLKHILRWSRLYGDQAKETANAVHDGCLVASL